MAPGPCRLQVRVFKARLEFRDDGISGDGRPEGHSSRSSCIMNLAGLGIVELDCLGWRSLACGGSGPEL